MFNVGAPEVLVILVVALLVLGPDKLPDAARKVGNVMGELRRMSSGFQSELRDAMQEPVSGEARRSDPVPKATPADTVKPVSATLPTDDAPTSTPDPSPGSSNGVSSNGSAGADGESAAADPSSASLGVDVPTVEADVPDDDTHDDAR